MSRPALRKLVLYSDQIAGTSDAVDDALLRLLAPGVHRVSFIPSESDRRRRYFTDAERHYARLGMPPLLYCDLEHEWDPSVADRVLAGDVIQLGSGDPEALLASILRRGLVAPLRAFVARGGVLVGVSAGAMILGKSIALASALARGELERGSASGDKASRRGAPSARAGAGADAAALGLVDFDFYPHYEEAGAATRAALLRFAASRKRPLYACTDADGLVVDGDEVLPIGAPVRLG